MHSILKYYLYVPVKFQIHKYELYCETGLTLILTDVNNDETSINFQYNNIDLIGLDINYIKNLINNEYKLIPLKLPPIYADELAYSPKIFLQVYGNFPLDKTKLVIYKDQCEMSFKRREWIDYKEDVKLYFIHSEGSACVYPINKKKIR